MKPIIGITVDFIPDPQNRRTGGKLQLNWNYAQVVADSGGIPVLIPPQADEAQIADLLDGLLIPGGDDIDARHFGEENHPKVSPIADERFELERRLYDAANADMPIFGICYGCQFLNVVRGGSLIQHLPDVVGHEENSGGTLQKYELDPTSKLHQMVDTPQMHGESWHHQAINQPGRGLKVVAKGEDGVVEAVEAEDRPWLVGVQWHPERTYEDPTTRQLFDNFIAAARKYREQKSATVVGR